jgi:N-acetylmuramoyl-L-alanine amidase
MVSRTLFFLIFLLCGNLFAQDSLKVVVAKKGEGIYTLLRKEGLQPGKYYKTFVKLNEKNLRDKVHLYEGRTYYIPQKIQQDTVIVNSAKPNTGTAYSIFGEKHALVAPKSTSLKNKVYYLVSGHGGPDPGAITKHGKHTISEDEYAYDITLRLAKELLSHGAKVYIIVRDPNDGIRDDRILKIDRDELHYPKKVIPLKQKTRLRHRVEAINRLYAKHKGQYQRLIVTHIDSRSVGQNIDVFFYHHKKSKNGKRLAESIHETFKKKYKKFQPNRNYTGTFSDRSNLYMVKNTHPAMVYIEIGNIRNKKDQRRILEPDNRQALAKWIAEGVLQDTKQ